MTIPQSGYIVQRPRHWWQNRRSGWEIPMSKRAPGNLLLVGGLEHLCFFFPHIGNFIIPTDFHIFQRGRLNHQPDVIFQVEIQVAYLWYMVDVSILIRLISHQFHEPMNAWFLAHLVVSARSGKWHWTLSSFWKIPSGKLSHNYGKIHHS